MSSVLLLPLLLLGACGPAEPDPCEAMCRAAADLYGTCLADWEADWEAAGYADRGDFLDACETWAWELRLLEAEHGDEGWTDATCAERADLFATGECSDFTDTDWNAMPWDTLAGDGE